MKKLKLGLFHYVLFVWSVLLLESVGVGNVFYCWRRGLVWLKLVLTIHDNITSNFIFFILELFCSFQTKNIPFSPLLCIIHWNFSLGEGDLVNLDRWYHDKVSIARSCFLYAFHKCRKLCWRRNFVTWKDRKGEKVLIWHIWKMLS